MFSPVLIAFDNLQLSTDYFSRSSGHSGSVADSLAQSGGMAAPGRLADTATALFETIWFESKLTRIESQLSPEADMENPAITAGPEC
jgi:hypothetical protein